MAARIGQRKVKMADNKDLPKALERLSEAHKNNPYNTDGIVSIPPFDNNKHQQNQVMKCKLCGTSNDVSVFQNTFKQFQTGQYVYLCPTCFKHLKSIDLNQTCFECSHWDVICTNPNRKAKWDNKAICPGYNYKHNPIYEI
jgi:hypothetical protein